MFYLEYKFIFEILAFKTLKHHNNRYHHIPSVIVVTVINALFTRIAKLDHGAHGARCAWAMAVHHAVGISRQRNNRPNRVNIMAQGLSTPDSSLSPTHLSIRRNLATTTHHTHHQVSLMVSRNTTLVMYKSSHLETPHHRLRLAQTRGRCRARVTTGVRCFYSLRLRLQQHTVAVQCVRAVRSRQLF